LVAQLLGAGWALAVLLYFLLPGRSPRARPPCAGWRRHRSSRPSSISALQCEKDLAAAAQAGAGRGRAVRVRTAPRPPRQVLGPAACPRRVGAVWHAGRHGLLRGGGGRPWHCGQSVWLHREEVGCQWEEWESWMELAHLTSRSIGLGDGAAARGVRYRHDLACRRNIHKTQGSVREELSRKVDLTVFDEGID
jgi:hypothetical protein